MALVIGVLALLHANIANYRIRCVQWKLCLLMIHVYTLFANILQALIIANTYRVLKVKLSNILTKKTDPAVYVVAWKLKTVLLAKSTFHCLCIPQFSTALESSFLILIPNLTEFAKFFFFFPQNKAWSSRIDTNKTLAWHMISFLLVELICATLNCFWRQLAGR